MLNTASINNSLVRNVKARVELLNGSALADTYTHDGALQSFTVYRVGEDSKFFGFGVCQRLNVKLRDKDRTIAIPSHSSMKIYLDDIDTNPIFYVSEVHRDETTNQLSITAYDAIKKAGEHYVSELSLTVPYTIKQFAEACASLMGYKSIIIKNVPDTDLCFNMSYPNGANFEGSETIRDALTDVAEATQTIFYLDKADNLVFKRLDQAGKAALTIDKSLYFSLSSKTNRRLTSVCHATELGDNVIAKGTESGSTQYVRDNAFWELREDIASIVEKALANVNGFTINQFSCTWRGDYRLEIGDKIALVTKDNKRVYSYILNDTLDYNGAMEEKSEWKYVDSDESAATPSTMGDALKQTFSRVDKINKQIDLVVDQSNEQSKEIANLKVNVGAISSEVSHVRDDVSTQINGVTQNVDTLTERVNQTMTSNEVKIEIEKITESGVSSIRTGTGYTFDQDGMTISKSGKEMSTTITEDGMKVYKDNAEVLTANNIGVDAQNLHATTYLIIGQNSRFEDYNNKSRTGCFWIG